MPAEWAFAAGLMCIGVLLVVLVMTGLIGKVL
jgi:hypothetical protein